MIEIKVPVLGESITTATVAKLNKAVGDFVKEDGIILELETEKINLEITATQAGTITELKVAENQEVKVDDIVAILDETKIQEVAELEEPPKDDIVVPVIVPTETKKKDYTLSADVSSLSPAVRSLVLEHNVDITRVKPSGKDGRILKSDILEYLEEKDQVAIVHQQAVEGNRNIRKEKTPNIRKIIAKRLKESQNTAAMLTTFNEVDMSQIIKIRKSVKDNFAEKYGVNLGYMSFFTKAVCMALKDFETINAYWQDDELEYHDYCDISVAVSSDKGLFVPVIRNAESLSFADIEKTIKEFGQKAKAGTLKAEDMQGGTFSITNGGIFGSMLSTPIINQPQSAILGMHNIVERAVVIDGKIVVRPIMYLALSYDHRIVDGSQAVSFLVKIKELLENPEKLMFDL